MVATHYRPAIALRPVIDRYWAWKQAPGEHPPLMPLWPGPGGIEIFFHFGEPFHLRTATHGHPLPDMHCACARSAPLVVEASGPLDFIAVRVRAGMAPLLTGIPMATLVDRCIATEALWGGAVRALHRSLRRASDVEQRIALLDRFFLRQLRPARRSVDISAALAALEKEDVPIALLSGRVGIGPRQLEHRFRASTGVTPARFRRLARLRRALRGLVLTGNDCITSLLDDGYVDQAHQIRDFRAFTGCTPGQIRRTAVGASHFYNPSW